MGKCLLTVGAGVVCAKDDGITGKLWDFRYLLCVHPTNL